MGSSGRRVAVAATLVALAGLILAGRLRLYPAPLHGDICAYAVIGHEMTVGGRPLYSDLWERKPPLLYLTFAAAERVVGYDRREILLVSVAAAWATLAGVYWAGRGHGGPAAGLFAAGLWTLLCADVDLAANTPDPEVFINAALAAAFAVLVNWPTRPRSRPIAAVALGLLLTAATLYKHNVALACAALLVGHVATAPRRWVAVAESVAAGGVVTAVWLAFLGHAYFAGQLDATTDVLFRQNVAYSGGGSFGHNLLVGLTPGRLFPPFLACLAAPAVLILAHLAAARGRRLSIGRDRGLWIAWAIGTWATVSLTGLVYPHYYELWLPLAAVGCGWAAVGLWRSTAGRVVVVGAFAVVALRQGAQFRLTPDEWVRRQVPYFSVANQNEMAERLGRVLRPDESAWSMGSENAFYFLAHRSPPSGLLFFDPLMYGGETDRYWRRLQADLERRPPDVVIFSTDWTGILYPPRTPLYPWLLHHYRPWQTWHGSAELPRPTTYTLWVRRGSRLDREGLPGGPVRTPLRSRF